MISRGLSFLETMLMFVPLRSFSTTAKGYICLTPQSTRIGDSICVFEGGRTPYVIRKEGDEFKYIGEAYIHGLMNGEAFQMADFSIQNITLV
jgi:hypothetical protein